MAGAGSDVFISYSRVDQEFVRDLTRRLADAGRNVWVDVEDIPVTAEWMLEVQRAIEGATAFCFVLSPASLRSSVCAQELEHAVRMGKRLVPVVRQEVAPDQVPTALSSRNWLWCRAEDDVDDAVVQLVEALETDLDWVRDHTRILVRAAEWGAHDEDRSYLLRGRDLTGAEAWLAHAANREPAPTDLHNRYLAASRRAADRAQRTRLSAAGVAVVVAVALAAIALVQRNEARNQAEVARAGQLSAGAQAELEVDPELGVLLASEAFDLRPTDDNEQVLRSTLAASHVRRLLQDGDAAIRAAAFSADGSRAFVADRAGQVVVYDARTGAELDRHDTGHDIMRGDFAEDAGTVVLATEAGVEIWPVGADETRVLPVPDGGCPVVALLPGDDEVVSAGLDGVVRVWNIRSGEQVGAFPTDETIIALDVSPAGDELAFSTLRGTTAVLDLDDGTIRRIDSGDPPGSFIRYSDDGRRLLYSGSPGPTVIDLTGEERPLHFIDAVPVSGDADLSPDGLRVLLGGIDGVGRVWDLQAGQTTLELRADQTEVGVTGFHPDGQRMITGSADGTVRIWTSGARVQLPSTATRSAHSRAGDVVATLESNGVVRVWDATTGGLKREFGRPRATTDRPASLPVALTPDGSLVAAVPDGRLRVWDTETGRQRVEREITTPTQDLAPTSAVVNALAFAPDGATIAAAVGDGSVRLFRVADTASPPRLAGETTSGAFALSYRPDGRQIAVGHADGLVRIWDVGTARPVGTVAAGVADDDTTSGLVDVDYSPDGTRLITASVDRTARVWDLRSGAEELALRDHFGTVYSAAFDASGALAITGSADGMARVWDLRDGALLTTIQGAPRVGVTDVAFSGDDESLLVTSLATRLYPCDLCLPSADLLDLAAARVTRPPTEAEQEQYGLDED